MQPARARIAIVHWLRYSHVRTPESLPLEFSPDGACCWKIGPDGPLLPDGTRGPSDTWCGVALYADPADGRAAFGRRALPLFDSAVEHWTALLLPIAHRGECNHLDRARPGLIFETSTTDPGGPLFVLTTAGFDLGPGFDVARAVHFRRHVDLVRESYRGVKGWITGHVSIPFERGDDGMTMTVWSSDADMSNAAYRAGTHRAQIDTHKQQPMCDRTSFTRFRMLESAGTWHGRDPLADARGTASAA